MMGICSKGQGWWRVLAMLWLFTTAAAYASVQLTLDMQALPKPISDQAIGGFNFGQRISLSRAEQALKPQLLRFPGQQYPQNSYLDRAQLSWLAKFSVASDQVAWILQLDTRYHTVANIKLLAQKVQNLDLKVAYWEIGAQPELDRSDGTGLAQSTDEYCATARNFKRTVRTYLPKAHFMGPSVSEVRPERDIFLRQVLAKCVDVFDVITWQEYPEDGTAPEDSIWGELDRLAEHVKDYRQLLREMFGIEAPKVGITELALSRYANRPRHLSDAIAGVWAAEAVLTLAESGVNVLTYSAMRGEYYQGIVDVKGRPRPSYYALLQLQNMQGSALSISSSDPVLRAHAWLNGNLLTVIVSNISNQTQTLTPDLEGWDLIGAKTYDANTVRKSAQFIRLDVQSSLKLPAYSVSRMVYRICNSNSCSSPN